MIEQKESIIDFLKIESLHAPGEAPYSANTLRSFPGKACFFQPRA